MRIRIAGGAYKGQRIKVPKKGIRPTKGLVREAIFNILGEKIKGAKVLDIFAGSGALGIEALSRGANSCVFIEKSPKTLLYNIEYFTLKTKTKVITGDFRAGLKKLKQQKFNIIFLDPPYQKNYNECTLTSISQYELMSLVGFEW